MMKNSNKKTTQYLLKQCTHLLSCDTSVYTIFGILSCDTKDIREEINRCNNGRVSEFNIVTDKDTKIEKSVHRHLLEFIETARTDSDIMLFADSTEYAESIMMILLELCTQQGIIPIVMVTNHNNEALIQKCKDSNAKIIFSDSRVEKALASLTESMQICHLAYMHNHSISALAHNGFGGGFNSPASSDALSDIISEKIYNQFVLTGCIDSRGLGLFWTPWTPIDEPELSEVIFDND